MNTHQMMERVALNLALVGRSCEISFTERADVEIDALATYSTDGNWSPIGLEQYEGGAWRPVMAHQLWPIERTEADAWLADAWLDCGKVDHANIDTAPAEDPRLENAKAAARWAWAAMRFFPHMKELDMVRRSILRDLVYTAGVGQSYMAGRCRQLALELRAAARLGDGTEVGLNQVLALEEKIIEAQAQHDDYEDLGRGFRSAAARFERGEALPSAWGIMHRKVRQMHIKRWALRFRDTFDAAEGKRDRLHERLGWHLCNIVRRNIKWCSDGYEKARPETCRMWNLQLAAWETMQAPIEEAYRALSDGRVFACPMPSEITAQEQRQEMIGSAISWTVEQYLARYGNELPKLQGPRRAALLREQAARERLAHLERMVGETVGRA
jgi:hypothetical protein